MSRDEILPANSAMLLAKLPVPGTIKITPS